MIRWLKVLKKKLIYHFTKPIDEKTLNALLIASSSYLKPKKRIENDKIYMYPAELSKCLRMTYHKYFNPSFIVGANPSALAGNIIDEGLKVAIKNFQKEVKHIYMIYKFPVHYIIPLTNNKKIIISGSVDFLAKNAVIELKSTSFPNLEPKNSDIFQLGFYTKVLSEELNTNLEAFLIIVYRRFFFWKIYKLSKKEIQEGFNTIIDRALLLYDSLMKKKEPSPTPNYWCTGCPLLPNCKEGQEFIKNTSDKAIEEYIDRQKKDIEKLLESYKLLFKKVPFNIF